MEWLSAAKDGLSAAKGGLSGGLTAAKKLYRQETAGVESKRAKARIVTRLLGESLSSGARSAHDQLLLYKHEAFQSSASLPVGALRPDLGSIRVEVLAAADLGASSLIGETDPYCMVAIGPQGLPWAAKIQGSSQAKTPVILRQRNPRWCSVCELPVPVGVCSDGSEMELTVRIMDAHATRADTTLGEARIPLASSPSGARTVRLLGGGFASCSLRWETKQLELEPSETAPDPEAVLEAGSLPDAHRPEPPASIAHFDRAVDFWALAEKHRGGGAGSEEVLRRLVDALAVPTDRRGPAAASEGEPDGAMDELILQAPLTAVFGAPGSGPVLEAIAGGLWALGPLAKSRVVGALFKQLEEASPTDPGEGGGWWDNTPADSNAVRPAGLVRSQMEQLLHHVLLSTHGSDLMELKRLIDTAGTGHNLLSVCGSFSTEEFRSSVLDHFALEAARLTARPVHILSDIDMTVWVGMFGAGGPKFPQGPIPGALSLFRALGGRITFLSARPPVWESMTRSALLDDIGIAEATVLQGTLQNVVLALFQPEEARRGMGEQKERAFNEFVTLYPEARFAFFGDSGEGDVDFALAFMEGNAAAAGGDGAATCRAALIHDVVGPDGLEPKTGHARREELARQGVFVFDTYVGAAMHLYRLGMLDEWDLRLAGQICADEFRSLAPSAFRSPEVWLARKEELEKDLQLAAAELGDGESADAADLAELRPGLPSPRPVDSELASHPPKNGCADEEGQEPPPSSELRSGSEFCKPPGRRSTESDGEPLLW